MSSPVPAPTRIRFDAFELDAASGELRKAGILLKLQPQPFRVLLLLVERAGQVVTREEIQRCLWTDSTFVDFEHGINFSINQIRGALADSAENPRYVETIPRRGYRFIGTVEQPPSGSTVLKRASEPEREKAAPRRWLTIATLLTVVVAAFVGATYVHFRRVAVLTEKDTIVLADFTNTTGDTVFDDTLRQGLSIQLEQSPFLKIISDEQIRQTLRTMGQKPGAKLTPDIARELCQRTGSAVVVDGSISQIGTQYVLGLKAVHCRTGDSLAEEQATASGKEQVLKALGEAAANLRGRLGEPLSAAKKLDTPMNTEVTTPSLEALKAFDLGLQDIGGGDYTASVIAFQRAIALDPNFAFAYFLLAESYRNLGESSLAMENAKKAYELRERVTELEKLQIEFGYYAAKGDLEKTRQTLEFWAQTYPRDANSHFNLSDLYEHVGQYEKALAEARESLRVGGQDNPPDYANITFAYSALNRLEEARSTAQEALGKKLDSRDLHFSIYAIAFLQNDMAGMEKEVVWAVGKPGAEDVLLAMESGTVAYSGQLDKARRFSRQAVASAARAEKKETAAGYEANAALREALFGNTEQARQRAAAALKLSAGRDVQYGAALALAFAGDTTQAQKLADDLAKRFTEDTVVQFSYLPTIHGQLALSRNDASKTVEALQAATPYELGGRGENGGFVLSMYPVYVRGQAYLASHQGNESAAEFQKILDHRGVVVNAPIGALAHLGLARAYAVQGDTAKAKAAYQDFLTLWKEADPDIPILIAAKAEYAKLR